MRIDLTALLPNDVRHDLMVTADPQTPAAEVAACVGQVIGVEPGATAYADGRLLDGAAPWAAQLHQGSVVSCGPSAPMCATTRLVVIAGLDAGTVFDVSRRSSVIGRGADCAVALSDPDISRRHAVLHNNGRSVSLTDESSTNGTWVDGIRISASTAVTPGNVIRAGNTVFRLETGNGEVEPPPAPALPSKPTAPIAAPPTPLPLAACAASAGAALAFGSFTHSLSFAALSLLTPLILLLAALLGRFREDRRHRKAVTAYLRDSEAFAVLLGAAVRQEGLRLRRTHPDPVALETLLAGHRSIHACQPRQVRVGLADQPGDTCASEAEPSTPDVVPSAPVLLDVRAGVLGIGGDRPESVRLARWIVLQLAACAPPDQLAIHFVLDPSRDREWEWARWLPQVMPGPPGRALVGESGSSAQLLVVVDSPSVRTRNVALADLCENAIVLVVDEERNATGRGITILPSGRAELSDGSARPGFIADGVGGALAERLARAIAGTASRAGGTWQQPETDLLGLIGSMAIETDAIRRRWESAEADCAGVLGVANGETFDVDLCRDGPHALVVGTTGSGKSELLRTWVASLALNYPPDALSFVLIDYKGGAAFGGCEQLPHVSSIVTDLDAQTANRALCSLRAELRRREALFAAAAVDSLEAYTTRQAATDVARLVVIVDEFAALAQDQAEFLDGLISVAQRGRSLGVHLILATQRASGAISSDIRANCSLRIALRVADANDSQDLVGVPDAAGIPAQRKGAAIALTASGLHRVQLARVSAPHSAAATPTAQLLGPWRSPDPHAATNGPTELSAVIQAVTSAADAAQLRGHPAPWIPPLPAHLALASLDAPLAARVPFGMADLPEQQIQAPLVLDLEAGGAILVTGPPRSGRTDTLVTLALGAAARLSPRELVIYAIDAAGGSLMTNLHGLPHVGTSTSVLTSDRVATLLTRLLGEVRRRQAAQPVGAPAPERVLVLVDGRTEFARHMDAYDNGQTTAALEQLITQGPAVGISCAVTSVTEDHARVTSAFAERYCLAGPDYATGATQHRHASTGRAARPPGRGVRASDGAEIQIAAADDQSRDRVIATDTEPAVDRITLRPLPDQVGLDVLTATREFVLGVGGDDAHTVELDLVRCRSRLLVAGPPASGKSTVLVSLLRQCLDSDIPVSVAAEERSPLFAAARSAGLPVLSPSDAVPPTDCCAAMLLIDDVERFVDHPAGEAITSAICAPDPSYAVVAAGDATDLAVLHRPAISQLRRARNAVLLQPRPIDGELVGVRLAQVGRTSRPGRGLLVAGPDELGPEQSREPIALQVATGELVSPCAGSGDQSARRRFL